MADYSELLPNQERTDTPEFLRSSPQLSHMDEIFRNQDTLNQKSQFRFKELLEIIKKKFPQWSPMAQHLHAAGLFHKETLNDYTGYRKEQIGQQRY